MTPVCEGKAEAEDRKKEEEERERGGWGEGGRRNCKKGRGPKT